MLRKMEQQMEMKFKAGIGSVVSWEEVSKSYREALDTARQGVGKVNHAKDLPVSCVYEEGYPYDMESHNPAQPALQTFQFQHSRYHLFQ